MPPRAAGFSPAARARATVELWDTIEFDESAAHQPGGRGLGALCGAAASGLGRGARPRHDAEDDNREWVLRMQRQFRQYFPGPSEPHREFYFTRAFYSSGRNDLFRGFPSWSVDYPKADLQFLMGLKRLVNHLD